jgi:hypothetical protein
LIRFVLTPVLSPLLTLALIFYFAGGRHGGLFWLIDFGCSRHMTGDRRWFSNLTPVMTKEYITFRDIGKGRVLLVGIVKVSKSVTLRRVSLVKSLGYNLLSVSQLLDEGFEVHFKAGCSRVLDSRGDLVCTIVLEGQIFRADFSHCVGSSRCLVAGVSAELWKWHRMSYGPPCAHYLGGYQDRLLGGPLGLPGLRYTAPEGVEHKDYTGVVLG